MIEVSVAYDERLNAMTEWAQLLFMRILPHTDDSGRFTGSPVGIKARAFPMSERKISDFSKAVGEMIEHGVVAAYKVRDQIVLQYNRSAFERINAVLIKNSTVKSEYPEPENDVFLSASEYLETTCQPRGGHVPARDIVSSKQYVVSSKQKAVRPENLESVVAFFTENGATAKDAQDFWDHFSSNGWRVGGRAPMKDWHAAARKWIRNIPEFKRGTVKQDEEAARVARIRKAVGI